MDFETVIIFAGIAVLAIPLGVILLWVGQNTLRGRVAQLESEMRQVIDEVSRLRKLAADPQGAVAPPTTVLPPLDSAASVTATVQLAKNLETASLAAKQAQPAIRVTSSDQDRPLVLRPDRFAALIDWLQGHWVYVISALSLGLAGVFFVQYGVEKGLLPPAVRVAFAILFGAALIVAGEYIRRRWGDDKNVTTAYLPSVFSGAGLVAMFAGIVAGRLMYGLYGPEVTFAALIATAALAVGMGWRYGPLLVAVGLFGAAAAPFLVAGGQGATAFLYGYYALVAAVGLAVDAWRRWAWVSVLALVLGYLGGGAMWVAGAGTVGAIVMVLVLALLAILLPVLSPVANHPAPSVAERLARLTPAWPVFPTRLAAGAVLASTVALVLSDAYMAGEALFVFAALTAMALYLMLMTGRAPGLADLAVLPAVGFVARIVIEADGMMAHAFRAQSIALRGAEVGPPVTVTLLLGMGALISGGAALRARMGGMFGLVYGLCAVLVAPISAVALEMLWQPALVMGDYLWALHIIALAAMMTGLALMFARLDGADHRRMAYATLSALSLIAFALFLLTTQSALTLALAALVVVAVWLDKRFDLREMTLFVQAAAAVLSYRLVLDPGLIWALDGPLPSVLLTYAGVIAALAVAYRLLRAGRVVARAVLESAIAAAAALLANIVIMRWLGADSTTSGDSDTYWGIMLNALPWLAVMLVQLYRLPLGGPLKWVRIGLAGVAGVAFGFALLAVVTFANPLFAYWPEDPDAQVLGPVLLNTLFLTYALPGLIFLAARRMVLPAMVDKGFLALGIALLALYGGLEIRHFWHGAFIGGDTVLQGELYSYTLALMVLGAALLYQSIARRSALLRKIGMAVIAVTIAKVFFVDAAGLSGLTRVFSFLGLGLSLAGLAWLNRWAAMVSGVSKESGNG